MHPMKEILARRAAGESCGIASYCSANELVIEAALRRAKINGKPVLIEATANQVNQYGGYTGMTPAQFYQKMMGQMRFGWTEAWLFLAAITLARLPGATCLRAKQCPRRKSWCMIL